MNKLSQLIKKYLEGHCTPEEAQIVEEFIKLLLERYALGIGTPEEQRLLQTWLLKGKYAISDEAAAYDLLYQSERVWARLQYDIHLPQTLRQKTLHPYTIQNPFTTPAETTQPIAKGATTQKPRKPTTPRRSPVTNRQSPITPLRFITSAAAAIIIAILLVTLPPHPTKDPTKDPSTTLYTSTIAKTLATTNTTRRVRLIDGSVIHLNQNTTLHLHHGKFNAHTREIWLHQGEAFFEIAPDPTRPFIVHTPDGLTTKVLGTSFNIQAYPQLTQQVITVKTGKVQVSSQEGENIYLQPDQAVAYNHQTRQISAAPANGKDAADWRNGRVVLTDATFQEVALRLHQHYQIELIDNAEVTKGKKVYFTFTSHTTIQEVAIALADIYGAKYKITENQLILSKNKFTK